MTRDGTLYRVEHVTRFRYSEPVRESVVTLYLQPRSDASQHLESFQISTDPGAELGSYEDCFGNAVHFFDVPSEHDRLTVTSRSLVALHASELDEAAESGWNALGSVNTPSTWHLVHPTPLTRPTPALDAFVARHGIKRGDSPLASVRELTSRIHEALAFERGRTRVDSPIDDALVAESGVCQDFSHIMLAIVRSWGIPAQYVSGYLFPVREGRERAMAQASHAWIECLLPGLGWVGADPTNNTVSPGHHIRVASGRDYRDVPPTRGTFRGSAQQELEVQVRIATVDVEPSGGHVTLGNTHC
jgi:transglutaminase-like putative cysteine protease